MITRSLTQSPGRTTLVSAHFREVLEISLEALTATTILLFTTTSELLLSVLLFCLILISSRSKIHQTLKQWLQTIKTDSNSDSDFLAQNRFRSIRNLDFSKGSLFECVNWHWNASTNGPSHKD